MEDLKKIALENIRNFIKVTPKKDILSRLAILSGDSKEGYVISSIISEDFINYCNRDLPIEEMVVVQVNWPDIAYFFQNNFQNPQNKRVFFITSHYDKRRKYTC